MTSELPERGGRSRSAAASRLAALVADVERSRRGDLVSEPGTPLPLDAPSASTDQRRAPPADGEVGGALAPPILDADPTVDDAPPGARPVDPVPAPGGGRPPSGRGRRAPWRTVAVGTAFALLVVAIPALGWSGFQVLLDSRDGRVLNPITDPEAPGYEAIVDPTPTTLVVQTDQAGELVGITLLALGAGEAGGSVVFIPADTPLVKPLYLTLFTLRDSFVSGGAPALRPATAERLGLGFGEVNVVTDDHWAGLVGPVAPLRLDNPDAVSAGGRSFPAGPLELAATDVGPYLAATRNGESDLARLVRHEQLWRAWLAAISASTAPAPIPGETGTGIGKFVGTLAGGTVDYATLPVDEVDRPGEAGPGFEVDVEQLRTDMTEAVPFPVAPAPGKRTVIRVLNGVRGGPLPSAVTDTLVRAGSQISAIGNARSFGRETTRIEYYETRHRDEAEAARDALGAGTIELRRGVTDSVDLNVIIGADVLDQIDTVGDDEEEGG